MDTDLLNPATGTVGMDQLVRALQDLRAPTKTQTLLRALAFNGQCDADLIISQCHDMVEKSGWNERRTLLQLRSSLKGAVQVYRREETVGDFFQALQNRYGISSQQAKKR